MTKTLLNLCGPTAVGKTNVALYWAEKLGCPILSTDSRQCYRELAVGSAPPSREELDRVPHYFIADRSIQDPITAGEYEHFALATLEVLFKTHDVVVAVGGSGMYIDALLHGLDPLPTDPQVKMKLEERAATEGLAALKTELYHLDPEHSAKVDVRNPRRVIRALEVIEITGKKYSEQLNNTPKERPFKIVNWVLNLEREVLYERIKQRVHLMLAEGLEEEARGLIAHQELVSLQTVGYREWWPYFKDEYDRERTIELIQQYSRRYAKRQLTYFKRFNDATWLDPNDINVQEESLRKAGIM
ncbi:MAG: tRNA (adenosine(37)-N6)-dimethylallyltransferase MiaA [Bacteroidetes bacterium]|nr:tRNA (adenosine(37)-N6)-dimethylallyltransferase MiaA [Bacteroidota bacterium]MDA0898502.1 tRNA (adenosine(37)-N6)-dimethylallyltransferase MiaA [Bacteroidota bacterium]